MEQEKYRAKLTAALAQAVANQEEIPKLKESLIANKITTEEGFNVYYQDYIPPQVREFYKLAYETELADTKGAMSFLPQLDNMMERWTKTLHDAFESKQERACELLGLMHTAKLAEKEPNYLTYTLENLEINVNTHKNEILRLKRL